jgi:uncharacterized protein
MMRKPKFEMLVGDDGKVYFHLKAANGEIVLSGRGYSTKYETIQAIASVMRYGAYESRFMRRENAEGKYFFQLLSPSGRVLGWSQMYHSKQGRDNGIVAVRRAVQFGRVLDLN